MSSDAVAATMAHEVEQPLTAIMRRADNGFRWLDRSIPDLEKAKLAFKQIAAGGYFTCSAVTGDHFSSPPDC
jgi:hypothetical protein